VITCERRKPFVSRKYTLLKSEYSNFMFVTTIPSARSARSRFSRCVGPENRSPCTRTSSGEAPVPSIWMLHFESQILLSLVSPITAIRFLACGHCRSCS
jgi:hypothetical protein